MGTPLPKPTPAVLSRRAVEDQGEARSLASDIKTRGRTVVEEYTTAQAAGATQVTSLGLEGRSCSFHHHPHFED